MNVLLFVMAMLMIMGMMTYTKLNKFRSHSIVNAQFENYMEFTERQDINEIAEKTYDGMVLKTKNSADNPKRNTNLSKLPIAVLLEGTAGENTNMYQTVRYIFKEIIKSLYSSQDFFKELQKEKPDFIDEIINLLPQANRDLPGKSKLTTGKDLANFDLKDPALNTFLYKILKGASYPSSAAEKNTSQGYPPLTDYFDVKKNKKLRIYLAPLTTLRILFPPHVADEIVQTREYFYVEVSGDRLTSEEATKRFQAMFGEKLNQNLAPDLFDFAVTKTDPKKYK